MGADGVVILLADQPQLSVNHLNALVAMASESFAVSSSLGAFAPPIYFSSACFPYVKELKGDEGGSQAPEKRTAWNRSRFGGKDKLGVERH